MRPCENVIVTIQLDQEAIDMELPAFLPINQLTRKLEETFRVMRPSLFSFGHVILSVNGQPLDGQIDLAHYGIWDGSIIECKLIKEVTT